jgi:hypothetical protein
VTPDDRWQEVKRIAAERFRDEHHRRDVALKVVHRNFISVAGSARYGCGQVGATCLTGRQPGASRLPPRATWARAH